MKPDTSNLLVKDVDRRIHEAFKAAAALHGMTIRDRIQLVMAKDAIEAGTLKP